MKRLSRDELDAFLTDTSGWDVVGESLSREFRFKTFRRAMVFVNAVAELATEARHHPDIFIRYNQVTLTLTTHDAEGLTDKDLAFVRAIEDRRLVE